MLSVDLFSCDCECGCAAKIPPDRLRSILSDLDLPSSASLVIGPETLDDAGVYEISDGRYLVQTVDYFPPVARHPYVYGQIAAANSLSDVYAMGGNPLTALAIVCFPAEEFGLEVLKEITRGAVDKLREAGAVLLGGHSIIDSQPKYGLAVTGIVDRDKLMDNAHARPGDVLVLTKPLGTGVTIMAAKGGLATAEQENEANRCMSILNAAASRLAVEHGADACTDITGFGLLGHAYQMADVSGVSMEIAVESVPVLENALEYAGMGLLSAAAYANRRYVGDHVAFDDDIALPEQDLMFDPQTSGGLLVCCSEKSAELMLAGTREALSVSCGIIGKVTEKERETVIRVRRGIASGKGSQ
ncbi:selenide, water dikinase SelD [Verrucomicrobiota bacterium]